MFIACSSVRPTQCYHTYLVTKTLHKITMSIPQLITASTYVQWAFRYCLMKLRYKKANVFYWKYFGNFPCQHLSQHFDHLISLMLCIVSSINSAFLTFHWCLGCSNYGFMYWSLCFFLIDHFWVPLSLSFKASLRVQKFLFW